MVEVGQVIRGKYKLLRLLGDGGMGSVYEGEHLDLGTHVAIKVLHSELARKPGLIDRFLQEARVSAQIRSPHVVQVTDVERSPDGIAYLVMELLQGEPLYNVLRREKKLPVPTALEYTHQILRGLEAAHSLGVIHRDLKPDNVFVTFEAGRPVLKLIDFGIAKLRRSEGTTKSLTVAGMLMGTPEYMAPEQAYSADKVDVRADLYAVGVMMYEMLSGRTPVSGEDPRVLVLKVERGEVEPLVHVAPGIEPGLAGFVHRAMAPRPEMRFANATEMRLALEAIQAGKKVSTAPLPAGPPHAGAAFADTADARDPAPAHAPMHVPAHASAHPPAAPAGELSTGTVMGAPVEAALAPGLAPKTSTVAAAPLAAPPYQGAPPPIAQPTPPPYEATRPPSRRGGTGLVVALALVATLLGAGAVVTYVMSTSETAAETPPPAFTTTPTVATTTPTTTVAATTATSVTPTPPLTTAAPLPRPPSTPPEPRPRVDAGGGRPQADAGGGGGGQAQADAGAPSTPSTTFVIPGIGSFQWPGPRPPLYPPDQPWPPPAPTWPPPP